MPSRPGGSRKAGRSPMWFDRVALGSGRDSGGGAGVRGFATIPSGSYAHAGGNRRLEYRCPRRRPGAAARSWQCCRRARDFRRDVCSLSRREGSRRGWPIRWRAGRHADSAEPGSHRRAVTGPTQRLCLTLSDGQCRFNAPESLNDNQVYAVSAYVLSLNGIVSDGTVLDAQSLPKIVMPNGMVSSHRTRGPDIPLRRAADD